MTNVLALTNVQSGYGDTTILKGVSLSIEQGVVSALLGRNGMGKSTLLETIMGFCQLKSGSIALLGEDLTRVSPERRMIRGIGYVPQAREIFASLTVEENLRIAFRPGGLCVEEILELLPTIKKRLGHGGSDLSGGEQQLVAIGRAIASGPKLLLLDEPTEGLSPNMVETVVDVLRAICSKTKTAMLLVEHKVALAMSLADEVNILDRGEVVFQGQVADAPNQAFIEEKILRASQHG